MSPNFIRTYDRKNPLDSLLLARIEREKLIHDKDLMRLKVAFFRSEQKTYFEPVSDLLISLGIMSSREVALLLADTYNTVAVTFSNDAEDDKEKDGFIYLQPDRALAELGKGQAYLGQRWLPVLIEKDTMVLATTHEPTPRALEYAQKQFPGYKIQVVITTLWEIRRKVLEFYSSSIALAATNDLYEKSPEKSARTTFTKKQKWVGLVTLGLFIVAVILWPIQVIATSITVLSLAFLGSILFKYVHSIQGAKLDNLSRIRKIEIDALRDDELPVYTVLVPVYKEANIVSKLVKNLGGLDYPQDKLEVLILTEEDDQETRDAVAASNPPKNFHVITIPDGKPRTKPRACNVGLYFATGEYVVIYDAEDAPEADQLKKAVLAFRKGDPKLICVQAALNYFNDTENALARMFTLEYSFWFDYMLSGLEALKMPIPLGGTSNHFKRDALMELGGWDAWNVTEDADLGIRASVLGYTVGTINSTTMEEANTSIPNFIRQRSRWIKGYMQTAIVHARNPTTLLKEIGFKQAAGFFLLIAGTPLTFLAVLPLYAVSLGVLVFNVQEQLSAILPPWVVVLSLLNFILGNGIMIHLTMMGPIKRRRFQLIGWAFLNPVYWILHSLASYKAFWQLLVNPHYWEKTNHGLTKEDA